MARWWPASLERRIAFRYLRGQRGTRSASLQTLIAIGGFATGVTALIVVLGIMNGLSTDLRNKILLGAPHLRILSTDPGELRLDNWEEVLRTVEKTPGVVAAAPEVSTMTLARSRIAAAPAQVMGVEPGIGTHEVTSLDSLVGGRVSFTPVAPEADAGVVLGYRMANRLGVMVGDLILLTPPTVVRQYQEGIPPSRSWEVEVTGLLRTGMVVYDDQTMIMSRTDAQEFAGLGNAVTDIAVRLSDPRRTAEARTAILARLDPRNFRIETWEEVNAEIFKAMQLEKLGMGLIIFIIMVVAAFNIVGMLTMVVVFKTREIGILLAMGMRPDSLRRIFMFQGAAIGVLGTGIGVALGLGLSFFLDRSGIITIDPEIYFLDKLPVRPLAVDVIIVVIASIAASVIATLHPSRVASRLSPVEAIRSE